MLTVGSVCVLKKKFGVHTQPWVFKLEEKKKVAWTKPHNTIPDNHQLWQGIRAIGWGKGAVMHKEIKILLFTFSGLIYHSCTTHVCVVLVYILI